jgi:hypothetical protein
MSFELLLTDEAVCTDKHPSDPKAKVVACGSAEAAFQVVGKGAPIAAADAERFGVKTTKADATNYTLRIDSHTIARTPEEKAFAATQPQPGLQLARGEQIRTSANLALASLASTDAAAAQEADAEAKKDNEAADKKLKAKLEDKSATRKKAPKATKAPRAKRAKKTTKPAESTPA